MYESFDFRCISSYSCLNDLKDNSLFKLHDACLVITNIHFYEVIAWGVQMISKLW